MRVAERAERVVEDHPTRRVQQQAGKRQALLLVERQLPVPALDAVEQGTRWPRSTRSSAATTAASSKRPGSAG